MHTKGEWKATDYVYVDGEKRYGVETADEVIATDISEANAQLIASAPRLVEWLEKVAIKQGGWIYQADLDEARDILAKAEVKNV